MKEIITFDAKEHFLFLEDMRLKKQLYKELNTTLAFTFAFIIMIIIVTIAALIFFFSPYWEEFSAWIMFLFFLVFGLILLFALLLTRQDVVGSALRADKRSLSFLINIKTFQDILENKVKFRMKSIVQQQLLGYMIGDVRSFQTRLKDSFVPLKLEGELQFLQQIEDTLSVIRDRRLFVKDPAIVQSFLITLMNYYGFWLKKNQFQEMNDLSQLTEVKTHFEKEVAEIQQLAQKNKAESPSAPFLWVHLDKISFILLVIIVGIAIYTIVNSTNGGPALWAALILGLFTLVSGGETIGKQIRKFQDNMLSKYKNSSGKKEKDPE